MELKTIIVCAAALLCSSFQSAKNKKVMTFNATTVSVSIGRQPETVYNYVADPQHFPEWAPGFVRSVKPTEDALVWIVETAVGKATVRFAEKNTYGILDHYVQLDARPEVYSPMRVLANDKGAEVIFTVYRMTGTTEQQFADDIKAVQSDLDRLKQIMEERP